MKKTISLLLCIVLLLPTIALASGFWTCPNCGTNGLTGNFCPNCGQAKTSSAAKNSGSAVNTGSTVTFGHYKAEPIEWIVLTVSNSRALLVSKYVLSWNYFSTLDSVTFEDSTICRWLNTEFLYGSFDGSEQMAIVNNYGSVSQKVFLLSEAEVRRYMGTLTSRIAYPTMACANEGAYTWPGTGACDWWLRDTFQGNDYTNGKTMRYTKLITGSGDYDLNGQRQNINRRGVRPAMWVDVSLI